MCLSFQRVIHRIFLSIARCFPLLLRNRVLSVFVLLVISTLNVAGMFDSTDEAIGIGVACL